VKALGVRMRNILAITLVIIASGVSALDRRGMFVCTPMSSAEKPIIYAFDGEHLLRDNNLEVPFSKLSSLADNLDLYFAFEPTVLGRVKLTMQSLPHDERELLASEFKDFSKFCGKSFNDFKTIEDYYELVHKKQNVELQPIQKLIKQFRGTECKFITNMDGKPFIPISEDDFNHVKLTINFEKMWVIEERLQRGGDAYNYVGQYISGLSSSKSKKYQCKSLGIDVPDVDTSKSIVPLASNI